MQSARARSNSLDNARRRSLSSSFRCAFSRIGHLQAVIGRSHLDVSARRREHEPASAVSVI